MPEHNMMHCLIPEPRLERLLDQNGAPHPGDDRAGKGQSYSLWPTSLMVCRECWEVWLLSHTPQTAPFLPDDTILAAVLVVNKGNGSCEEEEDE